MRIESIFCRKKTPSIGTFVLAVILLSCQPDTSYQNDYEKFFGKIQERGLFNGNALVFENGEIVFQTSFGLASTNREDSVSSKSVFRLGSVSKQFTAMAIMTLEEAGKLAYHQDIKDFIPELPYEGITVRHLLNHTSGLPDYVELMDKAWQPELKSNDSSRSISGNQDIIELLSERKPSLYFNPGEKWEYSNTGYVLLASIVIKASGQPFEEYLKNEIFEKAGMENTVVYDYVYGPDENMPNRVFGLKPEGDKLISIDHNFLNNAQGDGGIYSTLEDLLKWDRVLYKNTLVSQETLDEAFRPAILNNGDTTNYGFGWFIDQTPSGTKSVEHGGSWVGFRTYCYRGIEDDKFFIILTNNSSEDLYKIARQLKNIMYDQPYEIPQ